MSTHLEVKRLKIKVAKPIIAGAKIVPHLTSGYICCCLLLLAGDAVQNKL